jgi:hypothetical protein
MSSGRGYRPNAIDVSSTNSANSSAGGPMILKMKLLGSERKKP